MESLTFLNIASATGNAFTAPGLVIIETAPARHGTLIAPDLVVVATHYLPPAGAAVTPYGLKRIPPSALGSLVKQFGDISIFRLKYPLEIPCAQIAPIEAIKTGAEYIAAGWKDINTPNQTTVAVKAPFQRVQIDSATWGGRAAFFKQSSMARMEKGDSGSPVYVRDASGWKFAGVLSSYNMMSSVYSLAAAFKEDIEAL